jgi:hypothetical protein
VEDRLSVTRISAIDQVHLEIVLVMDGFTPS